MINNKTKHWLWVDVLNIAACLAVVLMHCSNRSIHKWNNQIDVDFIFGCVTHTLCYAAVPLFLMLSGCKLIPYWGEGKQILYSTIF